MSSHDTAPVRPIDGPALRRAIIEAGGPPIELVEPLSGGAVGAWLVRWSDGHLGVMTWGPPPRSVDRRDQLGDIQALMDIARNAGLPVPRYEAVIDVGELGAAVLQEKASGILPTRATRGLVENLIAMAETRRGLLTGTAYAAQPMPLYLGASGPGYCLHQPLAAYSNRTRRLLRVIEAEAESGDELVGADLVHFDYHLGNILVDAERPERVTAILDWDGARPGNMAIDIAMLAFDLTRKGPGLQQLVESHLLATADPPLVTKVWAHVALRLVDWAIRHHPPEVIEHWLSVAEEHVLT